MTQLQPSFKIETETVLLKVSDGTSMNAYAARPAGAGPFPGMLVFQEAFGVNHYIRGVAERLAREGFFALAPELFHRSAPGFEGSYSDFDAVMPHVRAVTETGLEADAKASYEYLSQNTLVASAQVGAIGFCMGGRASFLSASACPLRAAVSFYGSGIAPIKTALISNPGLLERAPKIAGPLLFFWGGQDKHITRDHHRQVADALSQAGKKFASVEFSYADHGFFCDERASYNKEASKLAWPLTLDFLKTNLSSLNG
ncbi:MAG TPA: dienelactone hydrolase family protein [Elusimicrobiota bacterium]|jgi:carboxymethylenebutenolidase|nr:dienelactone hydrolase family protein [Elusimicrobiota bacterium]